MWLPRMIQCLQVTTRSCTSRTQAVVWREGHVEGNTVAALEYTLQLLTVLSHERQLE